jgi:uncharacterized damage-inducible protein DinB
MAATDVISTSLERNWGMVDRALEGLDDAILARQPNEDSNSMAWLLWHMNRVVDRFVNDRFQSKPQIWIEAGWHQRFGMDADAETTGMGWTKSQTAEWKPPTKEILVGYFEAVKTSAREYVSALTDEGLAASITVPPANEARAVSDMLGVLVFDNITHGGQIAYLRGYYQGMGWFV